MRVFGREINVEEEKPVMVWSSRCTNNGCPDQIHPLLKDADIDRVCLGHKKGLFISDRAITTIGKNFKRDFNLDLKKNISFLYLHISYKICLLFVLQITMRNMILQILSFSQSKFRDATKIPINQTLNSMKKVTSANRGGFSLVCPILHEPSSASFFWPEIE